MKRVADGQSLLPPVPESLGGRDSRWEAILHWAIISAQQKLKEQGTTAILLGGTATRLCYGLARPSLRVT